MADAAGAPGWRQYTAPDGRRYYHHKATKTTQWAPPPGWGGNDKSDAAAAAGAASAPAPAPMSAAAPAPAAQAAPAAPPAASARAWGGVGTHLCEHNRPRTKCKECGPYFGGQPAGTTVASSGQPMSGAYGVGGAEYDAAIATAATASLPGARGPHNREPQLSRRLGWKHAPPEWVSAHPAAHTETYWFSLGAERQRQIRSLYSKDARPAKRLAFVNAPKKWVEKTPDAQREWGQLSAEEQRRIREMPEHQEKRSYAKAPVMWKRAPGHTEDQWDALSAEEQFAVINSEQWRRKKIGERDRYKLAYHKSPLLWRGENPSQHTKEHWDKLSLREQQSIKRNQRWKEAKDNGPGLVQLKIDVVPISFYSDALPNWRQRNKEADWIAMSDEDKLELLMKAVTYERKARVLIKRQASEAFAQPPLVPGLIPGTGVAGMPIGPPGLPAGGGPMPAGGGAGGAARPSTTSQANPFQSPSTIAVQLPSWPGKPNIVYYSQYPHALNPFQQAGGAAEAPHADAPPAKRRRRGPTVAEKRLVELREFKEKHGHTWAMRKKQSRYYVKGLGNWCEKMREKKKKGQLNAETEKALLEIGFVWDWKDVPFKCTKKRKNPEMDEAQKMLLRLKKLEEENRRLKEKNAALRKGGY